MTSAGRLLGYAILGLVDAAIPAAWVGLTVFWAVAYLDSGPAILAGLGAAGVVFLGGAGLGAIAAARGHRPFPVLRWWRAVWDRLWPFLP